MLVDSHFHAGAMDNKGLNSGELVRDFFASQGAYLLEIALNEGDFEARVELATQYENLFLSAGIHPNYHVDLNFSQYQQKLSEIEPQLQHPKVIAMGEMGLDLFYKDLDLASQKQRFLAQIELANAYNKPIVIHIRDSLDEFIEILPQCRVKAGGVLHCFTGNYDQAKALVDHGFYLGFGGILTYTKKTEDIHDAFTKIPLDRILSETDAPFLTPRNCASGGNKPQNVSQVVKMMAKLRGTETAELLPVIKENFQALFLNA